MSADTHPCFSDGRPWPEVLLPVEVAEALRLDDRDEAAQVRAVRRLVERQVLAPLRVGKSLRFTRTAVLRCLEKLTDDTGELRVAGR